MSQSGYYTRLAASFFTAGLLSVAIFNPHAGQQVLDRTAQIAAVAEAVADGDPMASRPCAIGESALTGPFAPIADVLSVSPLGGVTAPGELLPAPYIRVNTRTGESAFKRRMTTALAPAKADIIALERQIDRDDDGRAISQSWRAHFAVCENVTIYYDRLDDLGEDIIEQAGGLNAFTELGGPDHIAAETRIRVKQGDVIGEADGFDIGLHDRSATPTALARPERYRSNPYARAAALNAAPSLVETISPKTEHARCAIDYLADQDQAAWSAKLGDSWGLRRAKGDDACRTALLDTPDATQGAWFTDSSHNAATTRISAIALAADSIDPDRLIFALHGRLPSLTAELVSLPPMMDHEREAAAKDFLSFKKGDARVNAPFEKTVDNALYCYERLRANFVGPLINGVILMHREPTPDGPDILRMEARGDALSCVDLEEPWAFAGNETTFYR